MATRTNLDPVTLAVIENGLRQVCSEMDLVHEKTSFSPVISEAFESIERHLSSRQWRDDSARRARPADLSWRHAVRDAGGDRRTQGSRARRRDHPERSLSRRHAPDGRQNGAALSHYNGELFCYLANTGHWPDTGGMVPGGFTSTATEIQQEGLRLPPVKLVCGGELVQDVIAIILHNIRVPRGANGRHPGTARCACDRRATASRTH